MKRNFHTLLVAAVLGLFTTSISFAIVKENSIPITKAPAPVMGWESLGKCFNYPESARQDRASGTVYVKVLVLPDGTVGKTRIQEGIRADLNMAAQCCLSQAKWAPAQTTDGPAAAWVVVPVTYTYRDPFSSDVSNWAESGVVKMDEQSHLETKPTGVTDETHNPSMGVTTGTDVGSSGSVGGREKSIH